MILFEGFDRNRQTGLGLCAIINVKMGIGGDGAIFFVGVAL